MQIILLSIRTPTAAEKGYDALVGKSFNILGNAYQGFYIMSNKQRIDLSHFHYKKNM